MAKRRQPAAASRRKQAAAPPKTSKAFDKKNNQKKDTVVGGVVEVGKKKKQRRQLDRRDTDEQIARYIDRKLSHVDPARIKNMRNAEGESINDFIRTELKAKRVKQGRLSSAFAVRLYKSFDLDSTEWSDLPEPPQPGDEEEEDDGNQELYECTEKAHAENKFERDATPLCNFLSTCDELSEQDFHSLLLGSLPGPLMDDATSEKVHMAILHYISRHDVHLKLPEYWSIIAARLDTSMKSCCESSLKEGMKMKTFLENKRQLIALYLDLAIVDDLIKADGVYTGHSEQVHAMMCNNFQTGEAMFSGHYLGCANELYEAEVKTMLRDVEHNDFAEEEVKSYYKILTRSANNVKQLAKGKKVKFRYAFELLNQTLEPMDVDHPKEAAKHHLLNRVKTIAINSRQVDPFWWEELVAPEGSLENCPSHLNLPEELIELLMPARDYMADLTKDCHTVSELLKVVDKSDTSLVNEDRANAGNFRCDILFIKGQLERVLKKSTESMIFTALPSEGPKADWKVTLRAIEDVKKSKELAALGSDHHREIDGVVDMVTNIQKGHPPEDKDIPKLSQLCKDALGRCSLFCKYAFTSQEQKKNGKLAAKEIYGTRALQIHFKALEDKAKSEKGGVVKMEDLRMVKQFKWLLEKEQKVMFYRWLRSALPSHSVSGLPSLNDQPKDKPNDRDASAIVPAGKACASGSSGNAGPPEKRRRGNGRDGVTNGNGISKADLMGKFFPQAKRKGQVR